MIVIEDMPKRERVTVPEGAHGEMKGHLRRGLECIRDGLQLSNPTMGILTATVNATKLAVMENTDFIRDCLRKEVARQTGKSGKDLEQTVNAAMVLMFHGMIADMEASAHNGGD